MALSGRHKLWPQASGALLRVLYRLQIIEQIMEHVAEVSGVDPVEVRRLNFLKAYPLAANPQMHPSTAALPCSSSTSQVSAEVLPESHQQLP